MWKCSCQISKLTQEIYHPPQKRANEKIINLALKKKKVKPQWKIHSMSLTAKKEKKNNSFPSLLLTYSFSKKEGIWGLKIGKSNSSWKEKVYLSNFYFIQVCFPLSLRGTQHFLACSSVFLLLRSIRKYAAAAAAKSLQSCPTLCDPIDGSPPGFPVPGILQARTLEWVAISFSNAWKWKNKVKSLCRVQLERPHGLQPTRLLCPWDFLGKSTGVGCHCLLRINIHKKNNMKRTWVWILAFTTY